MGLIQYFIMWSRPMYSCFSPSFSGRGVASFVAGEGGAEEPARVSTEDLWPPWEKGEFCCRSRWWAVPGARPCSASALLCKHLPEALHPGSGVGLPHGEPWLRPEVESSLHLSSLHLSLLGASSPSSVVLRWTGFSPCSAIA